MFGGQKVKQEYTLVVLNTSGVLLRTFEQDQFEEVVKYIEGTEAVDISLYRIQLVRKGPRQK